MTKTELINRLKAENEGKAFITRTNLKPILGLGWVAVDSILENLDYLETGETDRRYRRYLVDEVAEAILENRRR